MFRKLMMLGGASVLVMGLLFGRDALSYVGTGFGRIKQTVKDGVPVHFELERAMKMIHDLEPEIRRNMHVIAKEEVEVERLQEQLDRVVARQAKHRNELTRLSSDLQSNQAVYHYAGRGYSQDQVRTDLANRLCRAKTNDATVENLHGVLGARERGLEAARQKLEEMLAAKRQLVVDVENLEARQKMVEVAATASEFHLDESHLARTRELINDIQTRIEVTERIVSVEDTVHGEIPLEDTTTDDIESLVAEYLGVGPLAIESIADAQLNRQTIE